MTFIEIRSNFGLWFASGGGADAEIASLIGRIGVIRLSEETGLSRETKLNTYR